MTDTSPATDRPPNLPDWMTGLAVRGFKSIRDECRIEIEPLTILAGANSAGKSSIVQPLLLLKQTLEATYDPGALLLDGPNVRFTSAEQLLCRLSPKRNADSFSIKVEAPGKASLSDTFRKPTHSELQLAEMVYRVGDRELSLREEMSQEDLGRVIPQEYEVIRKTGVDQTEWAVVRSRCFLGIGLRPPIGGGAAQTFALSFPTIPTQRFARQIRRLIHVPGLRGNPARTYQSPAVSDEFPGTFEPYVAGVISKWQKSGDPRLGKLEDALETLGLASRVEAIPVDDTQVELRVGRLLRRSVDRRTDDFVSVADVGFGVSQVLPVLVALLVAEPGQLVYIRATGDSPASPGAGGHGVAHGRRRQRRSQTDRRNAQCFDSPRDSGPRRRRTASI